jgi:hypothetical protein
MSYWLLEPNPELTRAAIIEQYGFDPAAPNDSCIHGIDLAADCALCDANHMQHPENFPDPVPAVIVGPDSNPFWRVYNYIARQWYETEVGIMPIAERWYQPAMVFLEARAETSQGEI